MVSTSSCYDESFTYFGSFLEVYVNYCLALYPKALYLLLLGRILKLSKPWSGLEFCEVEWKEVKSGDCKETELSLLLNFFIQPHQIFKGERSYCIIANWVIFYLVTSLQFFTIHIQFFWFIHVLILNLKNGQ